MLAVNVKSQNVAVV